MPPQMFQGTSHTFQLYKVFTISQGYFARKKHLHTKVKKKNPDVFLLQEQKMNYIHVEINSVIHMK